MKRGLTCDDADVLCSNANLKSATVGARSGQAQTFDDAAAYCVATPGAPTNLWITHSESPRFKRLVMKG